MVRGNRDECHTFSKTESKSLGESEISENWKIEQSEIIHYSFGFVYKKKCWIRLWFEHRACSGWLQILFDSVCAAAAAAAALREDFPLGPTWSRRARIRRSFGCNSGTWLDFAWTPYSTHFPSSGQVRAFTHFTLRGSRCLLLFFKLLMKCESPQTSAPAIFFPRFCYSSCSLVSPSGCVREDEGFPEGAGAASGHPRAD